MASNARGLHGAVVHSLDGKDCGAAVAIGTLITGHSGRGGRRNMVTWFGYYASIGAIVAGGAIRGSEWPGG